MIERTINGTVRQFRYGTRTLKIIATDTGEKLIKNVYARILSGDTAFISSFLLACANTVILDKGDKELFNENDADGWIDGMGFLETEELITELIQVYNSKNQKAPTTEAGQTT